MNLGRDQRSDDRFCGVERDEGGVGRPGGDEAHVSADHHSDDAERVENDDSAEMPVTD